MAEQEIIDSKAVAEVLRQAVEKHADIAVAIQNGNRWMSFKSRLLRLTEQHLAAEGGSASRVPLDASLRGHECVIQFRAGSFRYFADTMFAGLIKLPGDTPIEAPAVAIPSRLKRFERRASCRTDVSLQDTVRAVLTMGSLTRPSWLGTVQNLSVGGLQMRTQQSAMDFLEVGEPVSVAISFKGEPQPITLTASFRSGVPDGDMALVGLQFTPSDPPMQFGAALEQILKHAGSRVSSKADDALS